MAALGTDLHCAWQCNVANPDPEHCSEANQQTSSACNANAEFKNKILDMIAPARLSWDAK